MRIALAQINPVVGGLEQNAHAIIERAREAAAGGAVVVAFPELALCGCFAKDLLLKEHFLRDCATRLQQVASAVPDTVLLVGMPWLEDGLVYNCAAVLYGGRLVGLARKSRLQTRDPIDERRYFVAGTRTCLVELDGVRFCLEVGEGTAEPALDDVDVISVRGPVTNDGGGLSAASFTVRLCMTPYHMGAGRLRQAAISAEAKARVSTVCCVNGVGGQDGLVFEGQSVVIGPDGRALARAPQFDEYLLFVDIKTTAEGPATAATIGRRDSTGLIASVLSDEAEVYAALRLGLRDYVRKNDFSRVVLGMSGGIDAALVACLARDALGSDGVVAVSMPSRFSSAGTKSDAEEIAHRLGIEFREIPIERLFEAYLAALSSQFAVGIQDVTEQNIQARIRGNLLMALSNKFGWLVLVTSNKSETAVGYTTLYGDMAGGFAVLGDVYKTLVYRLVRYRNSWSEGGPPIPESTIERPPSAELADNQTDQDTLPPYEVLDRIIEAYVERDESIETMVATGVDRGEVERVVMMIDRNEYKRRQAAPNVHVTPKAFGADRHLPITNRYRG